ncbi:MAG TPA: hypothetical protein VKZ56_00415 [Membranihabitans sp.]|nr:hypothetical protein [Membranihabitans sp.]
MFSKRYDNLFVGMVAGTLVPILTFFLLYVIFAELSQLGIISEEGFSPDFRIRTLSLVSIATNVILVKYFQNRFAHHAVRGAVFPTFVYIIGWIIYFINFLL